ncbi:tyrosine-type recombinase/integrase [Streptomyces sp. NPDC056728]
MSAAGVQGRLVDEFVLALAASGASDGWVAAQRGVVAGFAEFVGRPVWWVRPVDVDGWLVAARGRGLAVSTRAGMAQAVYRFYAFLAARHGPLVEELTGRGVVQPVDEFNRPRRLPSQVVRVPPSGGEVEALFTAWRMWLPAAGRSFVFAARDYVAASLWRRLGLRMNETVMLQVADWRPDMGVRGMLHVRYGKGSRGRGPRARLVPAIDGVDRLLGWWLGEVRPQFGDDMAGGAVALLPSQRRVPGSMQQRRAGAVALRQGLAGAVGRWLPGWAGRLTPHTLRHFCASHLYAKGVDLEAIQGLLGHVWLSTTSAYVHVSAERVEQCWMEANARVEERLLGAAW